MRMVSSSNEYGLSAKMSWMMALNIIEEAQAMLSAPQKGGASGSAFFWQYDVDLNISENNLRVRFSDWIYQMDDYIAINKATVSKFGIEIGVVTIVFVRGTPASLIGPFNLSEW